MAVRGVCQTTDVCKVGVFAGSPKGWKSGDTVQGGSFVQRQLPVYSSLNGERHLSQWIRLFWTADKTVRRTHKNSFSVNRVFNGRQDSAKDQQEFLFSECWNLRSMDVASEEVEGYLSGWWSRRFLLLCITMEQWRTADAWNEYNHGEQVSRSLARRIQRTTVHCADLKCSFKNALSSPPFRIHSLAVDLPSDT